MKQLYIKQKLFSIGDKYNVYDENQNIVYYAKSKIFTFAPKITVYDASNDKETFFIAKKIFSFMPKYFMYKNDELVCTAKKRFTLFTHTIDIESKYGSFEINGDFFAFDFDISLNDKTVASVHKKWLSWGDTYEIEIDNNEHTDFYVALVIMIDNCLHNENNNNNND